MLKLEKSLGINTLLVALTLTLGGCAAPAHRDAMTPQGLVINKSHPFGVSVRAAGGSETGALESSNISDADMKAAIEDAVIKNKVFTTIVQGAGGDYELSVNLISMSKPLFGATFSVEMETAWSLTRTSDKNVALRKSIKSTGVATMSDSLVGVTRLRMAVENAARENIAQGLLAIGNLEL